MAQAISCGGAICSALTLRPRHSRKDVAHNLRSLHASHTPQAVLQPLLISDLLAQSQPKRSTAEQQAFSPNIPVTNGPGKIILYRRSRRVAGGGSASLIGRSRKCHVHKPAGRGGVGGEGNSSLAGSGGGVVDGAADRHVPAVDQLELRHFVGVAGRHGGGGSGGGGAAVVAVVGVGVECEAGGSLR